jgi:hypothetical protein
MKAEACVTDRDYCKKLYVTESIEHAVIPECGKYDLMIEKITAGWFFI